MNFQKAEYIDGTCRQGIISITFDQLCDIFGDPHHVDLLDRKVRCQWAVQFEDGTIATIYDWYEYRRSPKDVTEWHIGGFSQDAVNNVKKCIYAYNDEMFLGLIQ